MADTPKPADPRDQLEAMIQALATVSATDQVRSHAQAHQLTEELRERVAGIVAKTKLKLNEAEQRKELAQQIDKLVDTVSNIETDVGRAVAGSRDRLKAATRADAIGKMADALRLLSDWLGDPTAEKQRKVDDLIGNIRALTGASPYLDDARAEARQKAEIEADVKKSLDEIFGQLKIEPPL